jgi:predicted nuclease of predicted toxin-antitoxin system
LKNKPLNNISNSSYEFIFDTYSWTKIFKLSSKGWKQIFIDIIQRNKILITREVIEEIDYRSDSLDEFFSYLHILPKIKYDHEKYKSLGFDLADASLIEYNKQNNFLIVTEDHPMIAYAATDKVNFLQLIDFFVICYKMNQLTKNQLHKLNKELRKLKNTTVKKSNEVSKILNEL